MTGSPATGERSCPRCRFALFEVVVEGGVTVDHCYHCGGSFLDPGEETELLGPLADPEVWKGSDLVTKQSASPLLSPVSGQPMQRYRLFFSQAVEVDRCEQSGGMWLDAKEGDTLRDVLELAARTEDSSIAEKLRPSGAGTYLFQLFSALPVEVWNPRKHTPRVTITLITVCVLVFAGQMFVVPTEEAAEQVLAAFALQPELFRWQAIWGFITYAFLHLGTAHLLGNMYLLYIFGDNVEDKLGMRGFLAIYAVSTVTAALAQVVLQGEDSVAVVGASGAIAGVMAAYWVLFPRVRIRCVFLFVPIYLGMTTWFGIWIAFNVVMLVTGAGEVAWLCHLGGAAAGAAMAWPRRRKNFAVVLAAARGHDAAGV